MERYPEAAKLVDIQDQVYGQDQVCEQNLNYDFCGHPYFFTVVILTETQYAVSQKYCQAEIILKLLLFLRGV